MASSFDVSGLVNYVEEQRVPLMTATVNGAKMTKLVEILPNVKSSIKLPQVANSVYFQADDCAFDPSGSTVFSQRTLTVGKVKINDEWCPKDLETKYFAALMRAGSHKEEVDPTDVFDVIVRDYLSQISLVIDKAIWQGSTGSPTQNNYSYWDGFIETISSGYINANSTSIYDGSALSTAFTVANAHEMALRLYTALANNGLTQHPDTVAFVGYDTYAALVGANILGGSTFGSLINNQTGQSDPNAMEGMTFAGINLKFIPVDGLTGTNKVYAGRTSNFYIGLDAENDFDNFEVWYSKDNRKVRVAMEFKIGTQVRFPGEIAAIVL